MLGGVETTGCPRRKRAGQPGLEPGTSGFGDRRYHQLSYCPIGASMLADRGT